MYWSAVIMYSTPMSVAFLNDICKHMYALIQSIDHCLFPWNLFQFGLLHLAQAIGDCLLCLFLEIQIWPQTSHLKPWICIIAIIITHPYEISINTTIRYIFRRRLDTWLTLYYYSTCPAKRTAYMFLAWYAAKLSR